LYITSENKVVKVTQPKNHIFKPIGKLAGQDVLRILLYYKTVNRKPSKLLLVEFNRVKLDSEGGYQLSDSEMDNAMFNFNHFGFTTPQELANRDTPLPIPIEPVIPTSEEKSAIYNYIKEKLPPLSTDAPYIVESTIASLKQSHQRNIELIKQASKLK